MAEDGSTLERPRLEQKLFAKHSWRGKLFSQEEKSAKKAEKKSEADNNVADFLKSATNKQSKLHPEIAIPRLDTSAASRWPTAAEVTRSSSSQSRERRESQTHRPRVRKGKGLRVKFTSAEPVIIGEGGEESETPPRAVSHSKARLQQIPSEGGTVTKDADRDVVTGRQRASEPSREPSELDLAGEESFRPQPLRRTPTGISDVENRSSVEYDSPVSPLDEESSFLPHDPSYSDSSEPGVLARMRLEEGKALHDAKRMTPPSPLLYTSGNSKYITTEASSTSSAPKSTMSVRPAMTSFVHSSHSPQSSSHSPVAVHSGFIPSALVPGGTQHSTQAMPPKPYQAIGLPIEAALEDDDTNSTPFSLRSVVHAVRDDALEQFSTRVEHYNSLFHLAAERLKPIMETTFAEWIRAGTWWFLKGRSELETAIRSRPRSTHGQPAHHPETARPLQAYINLAKAWWIIKYITPQHPELRRFGNASMDSMVAIIRSIGDEDFAQLIEVHQAILTSLRALTMSMKRNGLLPPCQDQNPLGPGLDTSIWIQYPFFKPEIQSLLSSNASRSMIVKMSSQSRSLSDTMPLSDTKQRFSYGRKFVEVTLSSNDDMTEEFRLPCVVSVMRDRTDWQMEVVIASQNGLVNISIQPNKKLGLTWSDVQWETSSHAMRVRLPRGFEFSVQFSQEDFKMVWEMYEFTQKLEASLRAGPGEELVYETTLKVFQYVDPRALKAFPPEPSKRCKVLLFESTSTRSEPTGRRKLHSGYRLAVATSPKTKSVSNVSHMLGKRSPILFNYLRGEDGAPALLLKIPDDKGTFTLVMTFHEATERTDLHYLLSGTAVRNQEACTVSMQLNRFSMESAVQAEGLSASGLGGLETFDWQQLRVIKKDWEHLDQLHAHNMLSEKLRICTECRYGTITDHVNLAPGELQLNLSLHAATEMKLLRPSQEDLTVCVVESSLPAGLPEALKELLQEVANSDTIRSYNFHDLHDLHSFILAVTGFTVMFDGNATTFAISRRRMVVPIHKRWEAIRARLQVLKQDKIVQLAAFFEDFNHGDCMNFALKSTDVFESFNRSGKFCIRIVDAKFALPKEGEGARRKFVCLDRPDYPGEHDDIAIAFDTEAERDKFAEALPAPVDKVSRMGSLRK